MTNRRLVYSVNRQTGNRYTRMSRLHQYGPHTEEVSGLKMYGFSVYGVSVSKYLFPIITPNSGLFASEWFSYLHYKRNDPDFSKVLFISEQCMLRVCGDWL